MSDFLKILLRKNSLRKQCQGLAVTEVEKVISDLSEILVELEVEAKARAEEEKAKRAAIDQIQEAMRQTGVDLSDLMAMVEPVSAKQSVKAKYEIVDEAGNKLSWSGRGRTPVAFATYMAKHRIAKDKLPSAE